MGRACRKLAGELLFMADYQTRSVVVLCGPGNNGGDGFGLALLLHQQGWRVAIWLTTPEDKLKGDAKIFFVRAKAAEVPIKEHSTPSSWEEAEVYLPPNVWLVDALLGTGSKEAPRGAVSDAIRFIRTHRATHQVWSIDLPSGLDPDSGHPFDSSCCVQADHTLTLGAPKSGFAFDHSDRWTGSISVLDLGYPPERLEKYADGDGEQVVSDEEARSLLKEFCRDSHKGTRGHLLLVGGSPGMTGAISLSAQAALKSGCGLVTVLTPFSCAQVVDAAVKEAMVLPGKQGKFMSLSAQGIDFSNYKTVAVGPGLRVNVDSYGLVQRILQESQLQLVLDADALNLFASMPEEQRSTNSSLWLTPHPGEMARLLRRSIPEVQTNRSESVTTASKHFNARVLLKGTRSRMKDKNGRAWINLNGNPGMATGGSGDVLTGLLGSLLAQGVRRDKALSLAVFLHGRAGDLAAQRKGLSGMIAEDIVEAIPYVLKHLQGR